MLAVLVGCLGVVAGFVAGVWVAFRVLRGEVDKRERTIRAAYEQAFDEVSAQVSVALAEKGRPRRVVVDTEIREVP